MRYGRRLFKNGPLLVCRDRFKCSILSGAVNKAAPLPPLGVGVERVSPVESEPVKVEIDDTNDKMHVALCAYLGNHASSDVKNYKLVANREQQDR